MFKKLYNILRIIPVWAIALVCIVVFTNTVFFINRFNSPYDGKMVKSHTDWHIKAVMKGSPADIAGIEPGDLVFRFFPKDSSLLEKRISFIWGAYKSGDVINYTIKRDGNELTIPVTLGSIMDKYGPFYILLYVILLSLVF
ncbi:MAG: PDZ domain-containing protein [Saprospiraceae bacterium]|nr:PDZ domain-containing protein [Saprospiraceae bacterium]